MLDKIVFRKIGPTAMLYIIWWRLMIVILLHRTTDNREFINATWTNGRSCLATQDDLLRKFFVVFLIFVRTVIKTGYVHHSRHIIIDYCIGSIHTLSNRTCRIFTMADILQEARQFRSTVTVPLVGHLITDTPHNHARIIAILMNQIHQIFLYPFIKHFVITILYFGCFPLVKWLGHYHHAHFITSFNQFGSRHIMWSTDGIAAHVFQDTNLTANTGIIGNTSQRSEIMVIAHTFEHGFLSIQEETFIRNNLNGTNTEWSSIFILQSIPLIYFRNGTIKMRSIRSPQSRRSHYEILFENIVIERTSLLFVGCHHFTILILQFGNNTISFECFSGWYIEFGFQVYLCKFIFHYRSSQLSTPSRNMGIFVHYQMYIAI